MLASGAWNREGCIWSMEITGGRKNKTEQKRGEQEQEKGRRQECRAEGEEGGDGEKGRSGERVRRRNAKGQERRGQIWRQAKREE